jgi:hypothetical protein
MFFSWIHVIVLLHFPTFFLVFLSSQMILIPSSDRCWPFAGSSITIFEVVINHLKRVWQKTGDPLSIEFLYLFEPKANWISFRYLKDIAGERMSSQDERVFVVLTASCFVILWFLLESLSWFLCSSCLTLNTFSHHLDMDFGLDYFSLSLSLSSQAECRTKTTVSPECASWLKMNC